MCAVCGSNNWQIDAVFELRRFHGGSLVVGGDPILPVFPVTCNVCGNTVLINAVRAQVVEGPNAQAPSETEPEGPDDK
jgi:hypothetical protein